MKYSNPEIPEGINNTDTHPLKEFAFLVTAAIAVIIVITAVLAYSIDWLAEYVPYEYEKAISQSFTDETAERNIVDDYLQGLTNDIVKHMDMPEVMDITVHYVDQDVVNAMATLGGNVFIYRGLMEKLPHENALVMLLGHEIGHVKLRHPIKGLGKGVVISLVLASLLGQSSDVASGLLSDTSHLTLLGFSREQEEQADIEGLIATQGFYQHVQGTDELFKVLLQEQDEQGVYIAQIMSSHPDSEKRIELIQQFSDQNGWYNQGELKKIPEEIITRLKLDAEQADRDNK